jgi:hypothetical protein
MKSTIATAVLLMATVNLPLAYGQAPPSPNIVFVHPPPYIATQPQPNNSQQRFQQPDGSVIVLSNPYAVAPPRGTYDPAPQSARHATQAAQSRPPANVAGTSKALNKINPGGLNYGGLLAQWRIAVVQDTIESIYWWTIIVLCLGLVFSFAYNAWLLRERRVRLDISADNFAQLWNDLIHARNEALKAIEVHNRWVAEIDRKYEGPALTEASTSSDTPAAALLTDGQPAVPPGVNALSFMTRLDADLAASDEDLIRQIDVKHQSTAAAISEAAAKLTAQSPATICAAITALKQIQGFDKTTPVLPAKLTNGVATPVGIAATPLAGTEPPAQGTQQTPPNVQKMLRARDDKINQQRLLIRKLQDQIMTLKDQAPAGGA